METKMETKIALAFLVPSVCAPVAFEHIHIRHLAGQIDVDDEKLDLVTRL